MYTKSVKKKYFNMREVSVNDTTMINITTTFSTRIPVNTKNSFVQIPTNIYAYKPEMLNTVNWTEGLDETFRENYRKANKSMSFQFYGDRSGECEGCS